MTNLAEKMVGCGGEKSRTAIDLACQKHCTRAKVSRYRTHSAKNMITFW